MRFAFLNRFVNPIVAAILRSPAHGLLSRRLLLLTYTGAVSAASHTIPVAYGERDDGLEIRVGAPEAKRWWRNLRSGAPVELRLRGRRVMATARAIESGDSVRVVVSERVG